MGGRTPNRPALPKRRALKAVILPASFLDRDIDKLHHLVKTLAVDLATAERLAPLVPADRQVVCESGIADGREIARMRAAGIDRFLVGESLMRKADVAAATRALLAPESVGG